MYINDINILHYVFAGIIGLFVGQFIDWCTIRLPDYKKVFTKDFFQIYIKNTKPKYLYMIITAVLYIGILYMYKFQVKTIAYIVLIPMLIIAFIIYKLMK